MVTEAQYEAVLKFFYFLLLNEATTLGVAFRTIKSIKKEVTKQPNIQMDIVMISNMVENLDKYHSSRIPLVSNPSKSDWKIPKPQYLVAWREFLRNCDRQYTVVLVLRYILGYPAEIIAEGMNIPTGTVFFRLNRGLEIMAKNPALQAVARRV